MKYAGRIIIDVGKNVLSIMGSAWIVIKLVEFFYSQSIGWLKDGSVFCTLLVVSLLYATYKSWPYRKTRKRISGTDSYITVQYGDVLKLDGDIVISSSNYFNTSLDLIAPKSLLGQTIKKYYNSDNAKIEKDIEASLNTVKATKTPNVTRGKQISYPIGSVAVAKIDEQRKLFLVAITKIEYDADSNEIIDSNISYIHEALNKLWDKVDTESNDGILNMTPFGSGIAKAFNRRIESIIYTIQSFIDRAKKKRPCAELVICIKKGDLSILEYMELKKIVNFLA